MGMRLERPQINSIFLLVVILILVLEVRPCGLPWPNDYSCPDDRNMDVRISMGNYSISLLGLDADSVANITDDTFILKTDAPWMQESVEYSPISISGGALVMKDDRIYSDQQREGSQMGNGKLILTLIVSSKDPDIAVLEPLSEGNRMEVNISWNEKSVNIEPSDSVIVPNGLDDEVHAELPMGVLLGVTLIYKVYSCGG